MKDNSVDSLIKNITEVVLRTHFYYIMDYDLQRDLMQEGYLKAYELLSSGNYDPYRNLRTFIYTGVRNAMTNYIYHNNRESHVELDTVEDMSWQQYEGVVQDPFFENKVYYYDSTDLNIYTLTKEDIEKVCNKYTDFGDYTESISSYLASVGVYEYKSNFDYTKDCDDFIFQAIKGELLWILFLKTKLTKE